ncbi:MAG: hypothetical protein Q4B85_02455 [Lachnospiraceae bacterium]|nr:hypothetical protein [Lachnospiraceae bacterium]
MSYVIYRMTCILAQYQSILLPAGILISLALCFMGYKYLNAWVAAFAFMAGLGGGYLVSSQMIYGSAYAPVLIGMLLGVILMLLTFLVFNAGVFCLTATMVGTVIYILPLMDRVRGIYLPGELGAQMVAAFPAVIALLLGVGAGVASLKSTRTVIILSTGITGAYRAVSFLISLFGAQVDIHTRFVWLFVVVLLAALGVVVQFFTTKK